MLSLGVSYPGERKTFLGETAEELDHARQIPVQRVVERRVVPVRFHGFDLPTALDKKLIHAKRDMPRRLKVSRDRSISA